MKTNPTQPCVNCKSKIPVTLSLLKTKDFNFTGEQVTATYFTCPICGEINLCQLDTEYTMEASAKVAKLSLMRKHAIKLSDKQKKLLPKLDYKVRNIRKELNALHGDEINQSLIQANLD